MTADFIGSFTQAKQVARSEASLETWPGQWDLTAPLMDVMLCWIVLLCKRQAAGWKTHLLIFSALSMF